MPKDSTPSPIAHPYVRISHPDQRKGGGLERQTTAQLDEFCRLYGFTLSKQIRIDDGVSAFHGLNATPDHELGKMLIEARKELIRPDDCILIENYDRLSREDPWAAIALVSELRSLKIHVGRLDRMKILRWDSDDHGDFFECAIELMRGHSESKIKSMRNVAAWRRKRKAARENGETITHRLPAWIVERDGQRVTLQERVAIIKRIFALTANGYGHALIVKKFKAEGIPSFKAKHWARSYIALLLSDRRVLGEFQPRLRNGEPDGEPILDYYPRIISDDEWYAARAGSAQRTVKRGRQAKHINVFSGLVKNALGGDSYYLAGRSNRGKPTRVLINTDAAEGRSSMRAFSFASFRQAILEELRELAPHAQEILNGGAPDDTLALAGELAGIERELAEVKAFMDARGFNTMLGERIVDLTAKKHTVSERLAEARQKAAHPLSESWGELRALLVNLDDASEDTQLRLQSVLRRIIDKIMLLVVPRGRDRLAAVQIWFAGGEQQRTYLILHRPAKANAKSRTEGGCWRICREGIADPAKTDLRRHKHAVEFESWLAAEDVEKLLKAMKFCQRKESVNGG